MEFSRLNFEDFLKEKAEKEHQIDSPGQIQTRGFIGTWKEANDHEIYNEFIFGGYRVNFLLGKKRFAQFVNYTTKVSMFGHMLLALFSA